MSAPQAGPIARTIEDKVRAALAPEHLEVVDESYMHAVPAGVESHFRLLVVADEFNGKTAVQRHQAVYRALAEEMAGPVHALGLQTMTPQEWRAAASEPLESPECLGGSKVEA